MMINKNYIYMFIVLLLISCNPKLPTNKDECISESKVILQLTQKGNFDALKKYFTSKGYLLNYTVSELSTKFSVASNKLKIEGIPSDENITVSIDTTLNAGPDFNYKSDFITIEIVFHCKKKPFIADADYFKFLFNSTDKKNYLLNLYIYSGSQTHKIEAPPKHQ